MNVSDRTKLTQFLGPNETQRIADRCDKIRSGFGTLSQPLQLQQKTDLVEQVWNADRLGQDVIVVSFQLRWPMQFDINPGADGPGIGVNGGVPMPLAPDL
jgi:hypothetical protein